MSRDTSLPASRTFLAEDGLRIRAAAFGAESGPGVVLAHGGGQTRGAWENSAASLAARGFSVLAVDLRGHGESEWSPEGRYSIEDFASDIAIVARAFAEPPVLVGASLGGIASMVAEVREHVARALVLVDIAARLEPRGVARILAFMRARPDGFTSLDEAADAVAAYLPDRPRPADLSGLAKNLRLGDDGRYRWHWDPRFLELPDGPVRDESFLSEIARQLTVPTLLVRGKKSDLLSPDGARAFLDIVPHASFVDVSEAGHMVAGDRNDAFTEAVVAFLGSLDPERG